ncbi:MAG: ParB/RepB/Spo0J family partition protein [Burkholderiaceae bacterium]|jgi:ParB family chromosome partitioning protein|nr:ParB/RepB/Spo0J family partition protein [Burkholderiaceae bacterium]
MFNSIVNEPKELEELNLPIKAIWLPALEIRRSVDLARINELAESMKNIGQLHRIGVRPIKKDLYELIYGERRLRAAMVLNWEKIQTTVFYNISSNDVALAVMAAENVHTEKFRAIENIAIISELKGFGFNDQAIARILSQPDDWVRNHLCVMRDSVARHIAETGTLLNARDLKNFMAFPAAIRSTLLEAA